MTRHDEMMNFLNRHLSAGFRVESLAGDASFRRYHRIYFKLAEDTDGREISYLLMDAPPQKESVDLFLAIADVMSEAVNVPDILAKDVARGFLLLQDFGTVEFAHLIKPDSDNNDIYHQALTTLRDIQSIDVQDDKVLPYDNDKFATEMDLFTEWFLPYIGERMSDELWENLKNAVIADVQTQPKVLVHRDYHSRNLMQDKNSDKLGVIDFQDALIGPYTYDLVSLVRDAYIDVDENWVNAQIRHFYDLIEPDVSLMDFTKEVNVMGVQRHLKVLGIFIRLYQRDGKDRYLANIPKVMQDLLIELRWLVEHEIHPIYKEFLVFIQNIMLSYEAKFKVVI